MSQPLQHPDNASAFRASPSPAGFRYTTHPPTLRHIPGAELISALCDITEGIALVLEIVEQANAVRDGVTEAAPIVDRMGSEILLRYAVASAQTLNRQAWAWIESLDLENAPPPPQVRAT